MNLAAWAERNGVARVTAYRWFRAGLLPVPARKVGRLILVDEPTGEAGLGVRTAVYARVSSADQKADLDRQVARVCAWATARQIPVDKVVVEVGSALNGRRRKFVALLRDRSVTRIVVEHRDRFCRFGSEYVQAALAAQGRELVVVDNAGVDDDLVRDMTEILTSMCACHACGHVQDIGWDEKWQCGCCSVSHQRDDNAAINLARWEEPTTAVGPVGAAVKRGADRKTRPGRAGGCEARKGRNRKAVEQPRDGARVA